MQALEGAGLNNKNAGLDEGIKLFLAILLAAASVLCNKALDLVYFSVFLLFITVFIKSDLRFILKNACSFGIIILIPYFFGILLSLALNRLYAGPVHNIDVNFTLLKMAKIFFIWYIGNLYFYTSSLEVVLDMFDKVFSPLKKMGIPVSRYLNMVIFILNELSKTLGQFKGDIFEKAGQVVRNRQMGIITRLKELSNIIVNHIANSLQRTGEVQEQLELCCVNDRRYALHISRNEIVAIAISIIFLLLVFVV